jgi:DNA-binding PadR family transcriptional regulator
MLAAMHLGENDAHALGIADHIAQRTGRRVRRSTVYTTLRRLERKGLITTWLGDPRAERGGKARRHVGPTPSGVEAVQGSRAALESMWGDVDSSVETA